MKKTRVLLLSGVTCLLIATIPSLVYSGGGPGSGKKPPPPTCPTVDYKTIPLNLIFATGNVNGCGVPESIFSDFRSSSGASTLTDKYKYFCKITVTPIMPSGCTAAPGIFYWTTAGSSTQISIPKGRGSSITVEYYERCSTPCNGGIDQRRYFKFETTLSGTESFVNAPLSYVGPTSC